MKTWILAVCATLMIVPAMAADKHKDCNELKTEIDAGLQKKGVKDYSLDVVEADKAGDAKVVGSCEAGKKKVTYHKGK
ncbi:MAG: DUF1161 domain-containing protein [Burkholderiales bacterium]|nr:DUF1161 domain-containing protein [Burkholderiales bacterium]